ncbi:helix-turn-helix domain-containing protein [Haematospirillum jordaniae]|nr:helix-turn-helix domain-containing protein [Haematospirillum jordaniae]NKD66682.1 helix-turn-helix domain-containing protein [Haematospirillum jordaniae]NKD81154.1 helix-turn-helix domain-containing protein [Haematospirillum jordaniae]NKD85179.1 helix-turn-helix domain-containing protein [Haematospirillum jordaniae]NKD89478.1 helix-turn-helix domain-containing protein [Haematospirillum jordaniae]
MLLTETEVAKKLRCSRSKVKRLRLSGRLTYVPGRPVLVDEADLTDYLEKLKCRSPNSSRPTTASGTSTGQTDAAASASARARAIWLQRRLSSASGS